MQLKVIKADGSVEEYLHTKIIGTMSNALALVEQPNIFAAEQFAEAITFHLYKKRDAGAITSEEVHLMVQAVLVATGYENASHALNEYHLNRRLKRRRIEVVGESGADESRQWKKSQIVCDLMSKQGCDRKIARAIASAVEQKVLNLGMMSIKSGLIKQLVLADTEAMMRAHKQLQTVAAE